MPGPYLDVATGADADGLAVCAASLIAQRLRFAAWERGRAVLACSGGRGPRRVFERLAAEDVPWEDVVVAQVDERVVEDGHRDRNWTMLSEALLARVEPKAVLPMPVTEEDLDVAARRYGAALREATHDGGLDVVHLGLGDDGHTASLAPGDPVLDVVDRDVAVTADFNGYRRMTLTFPAIERARTIVWYVPDPAKRAVVQRLLAADARIPAGRVRQAPDVHLLTLEELVDP